jgi:peptidoglycan hydrolase CwlO-like protein
MVEITKNDIKKVFVQSLEPFANAIQKDIQRLDGKIDKVEVRLTNVEQDVKWMKENSSALFTKLDRFGIKDAGSLN